MTDEIKMNKRSFLLELCVYLRSTLLKYMNNTMKKINNISKGDTLI